MIYVSSSCVQHKKIKDSVLDLVSNGFKNIELSGGTEYYDGFEYELLELKDKYSLNYICHNYFPPPKEHFVLNLASQDHEVYTKTLNHLKQAIVLSKKLGAKKFAFHAGFFIDIKVSEIGKKISKVNLFNKKESLETFCRGFEILNDLSGNLELYIENNVYSSTNAKTYENNNLFMLTNGCEYKELKKLIDFNLLVDVAHLKVSSKTLNLNFTDQLKYMINESDYIHISDNDALHDLNYKLENNSDLVNLLKQEDLKNKDFTLEIYDDITAIKKTYEIMQEVVK